MLEFKNYQCRANISQDKEKNVYLVGRPIVFGQPTEIAGAATGYYTEIIDPGALDHADLRDVRFLVNHNQSMIPLARFRSGNKNSTMDLKITRLGLDIRVGIDVENNKTAKELYSAVSRGDMTGMSFAMMVGKDSWEGLDTEKPVRHITSISKVLEVSAVTFPAYDQTWLTIADRTTQDSVRASIERAKKSERQRQVIRILSEL